ncbi:helix-turn-helix domain-containing protein [Gracilibacillus alcaliphilus]|uniref:transcriptional regulator n=1 Tax=Gracilibacillus alcaliphilus TaxID=1401441 RepID=UPI001956DB7A|nr:transcriptional regulator [Gracilibacillus alcaliphilus]MBM7677445.1 DNA-binding transcriptional ArsR family regulator [Gracilibacillus alcaliphilus]
MELGLFKNQTRFKIALELIDKEDGLSIMQLNQLLEDIPQATLYRHVNAMFEDGLLNIVRKKKTRSGEENFYAIKTKAYKIGEEEWNRASYDEKVNFITYYFMYVLNAYQNYHQTIDDKKDQSTFSISKLHLGEAEFENFQADLNHLLTKYYNQSQNKSDKERTVSLVIIP